MFATYHRLARAKLAELRRENTEYNALLSSSEGERFASSVGSTAMIKQAASVLSVGVASQTRREASQPVSGQTTEVVSSIDLCIDARKDKYTVLNCLIFETAYRDWTDLANSPRAWENFKTSIANYNGTSATKLGVGDGVCTNDPTAFIAKLLGLEVLHRPACLKHDVAYDSLQRFVGGTEARKEEKIDEAWNPRNQHLANVQFYVDQICRNSMPSEIRECLQQAANVANTTRILELVFSIEFLGFRVEYGIDLAGIRHLAVRELTTKGPVTDQDITHTINTPRFVECSIPRVFGLSVRQQPQSIRDFVVQWAFNGGCTGVSVENVWLTGRISYNIRLGTSPHSFTYLFTNRIVIDGIQIRPRGHKYGPRYYQQTIPTPYVFN